MKAVAQQSAFTLIEALVASALSVGVVAMVLVLLVKNLESMRDDLARLQLSEHSRLVRERVLHGLNGRYGLRHARRAQLVCSADEVLFNDPGATNALLLIFSSNQPPAYLDSTGTNRLIGGGAFVDSVALAVQTNILNIELTLALNSRGKKYSQPQQIRVYLLNE